MSDDTITPLTQEDGQSKDLVKENVEKLKKLYPEIVTDGKIDFETLKEELGEFRETSDERYSFTWNGKSKARKLAMEPSRGTLRPAPGESVNWDNTDHLFIEGDNLEVLKLLQRSYHKKVKMIYIDPPYNTGNDFVYSDDYKDNLSNYLKLTGQIDGDGKRISTNPDYSGRYHTDWLNMMYPRLKIARELLKEDGAIFISIDDHEFDNLKKLCDEIFGEENLIENLIWKRRATPPNDRKIGRNHEYILCYAKNSNQLELYLQPRAESVRKQYSNPDDDPNGPWRASDLSASGKAGRLAESCVYPIENTETGEKFWPPENKCWLYNEEKMQDYIEEGRVGFRDTTGTPFLKRYLSEVRPGQTLPTIIVDGDYSQHSAKETRRIFGADVAEFPKPIKLMKKIIRAGSDEDDIVLDFFAGSSTSAQATLDLNIDDKKKRKFIMVQLPVETDKGSEAYKNGFKTISEIGKGRISRVIDEFKDKYPDYNGDLGFKVFKLDSSNIKPWDPSFDEVQLSIEDSIENIKPDRSEKDLLYEILLKYGIDLSLPIEEREIDGAKVFVGGAGALVLCPSDNITLDVVDGIVKIKDEYEPEIMRVVFRDSSFKNDVVKTNAIQILKQHEIEDVKSI